MSQTGPSAPPSAWSESSSISRLTPLLLLLVPSVLLLLLLNCVFLGYKLLLLAKGRKRWRWRRRRRLDSESTLLRCALSRMAEPPSIVHRDRERGLDPINPAQSVSSSLASSKESAAAGQRVRNTRPDGPTGMGSGSRRAPSTIMAALSTTESTARAALPPRADWRRGEPLVPPHCSDSDTERGNPVPPNSPELHAAASASREHWYTRSSRDWNAFVNRESRRPRSARPLRRSSTMEMKEELVHLKATSPQDLRLQCGYASSVPAENSLFITSANSSTGGPGLDSDFGASAGVSLRILSCDSEGLSEAILASGLEWDYYDPCYVSQNHIPRHMFHMPTVTAKQYWV